MANPPRIQIDLSKRFDETTRSTASIRSAAHGAEATPRRRSAKKDLKTANRLGDKPGCLQIRLTDGGRIMGDAEAVIACWNQPVVARSTGPRMRSGPKTCRRPGQTPVPTRTAQPQGVHLGGLGLAAGAGLADRPCGGPPRHGRGCAIPAILSGAFYFGRRAVVDLLWHRSIGFYFLMSAAAVVSALIGHAQEGAILVFLTSISEAAQDFTEWKTPIGDPCPDEPVAEDGDRAAGRADRGDPRRRARRVGELFIVKPGTAIATDGVVVEGPAMSTRRPSPGRASRSSSIRAMRSSPPASMDRPRSRFVPPRPSPTTRWHGSSRWSRRHRRRKGPASD